MAEEVDRKVIRIQSFISSNYHISLISSSKTSCPKCKALKIKTMDWDIEIVLKQKRNQKDF